jgi:hypothetical protein
MVFILSEIKFASVLKILHMKMYIFPQKSNELSDFEQKKPNLSQFIVIYHLLQQIQINYIDLKKYFHFNHEYQYCLVLVDVFSKNLWILRTILVNQRSSRFILYVF